MDYCLSDDNKELKDNNKAKRFSEGKNRFMPPFKSDFRNGVRDAFSSDDGVHRA
jgi:hypothetical protein